MQVLSNTLSITSAIADNRVLAGLLMLALGSMLILSVGFLGSEAIHNAAHDARHVFAFPCH